MAQWTVSDELDARLRRKLGDTDISTYIEGLLNDQLDYEEDPSYRARVDAQVRASESDITAGRVTDAREAMRQIARDKGIQSDR